MNDFWAELEEILEKGFTGRIVLHCNEGVVVKYDLSETRRPRNGSVELTETTADSIPLTEGHEV